MMEADEPKDRYESNLEKASVHAQKRLRDRGERSARINNAQGILDRIEPEWLRLKKEHDDAERELKAASCAFYEGERVKVTETCRRGCCVESEFIGIVVGATWNGGYIVKTCDDKLRSAWDGDMTRV